MQMCWRDAIRDIKEQEYARKEHNHSATRISEPEHRSSLNWCLTCRDWFYPRFRRQG